MTTCSPKQNCAHRLLGTVCSGKVGWGVGGGGGGKEDGEEIGP